MTEERKQKIKNSLKSRNFSGSNNPMYGKHHSPETRKKMQEKQWFKNNPEKANALIRKNLNCGGIDSRFAKQVVRLMDGKIYKAIIECAADNLVSVQTITNHCHNCQQVQEFMYKQDYNELSTMDKQKLQNIIWEKQQNPDRFCKSSISIRDLVMDKIYFSISSCAKQLHLDTRTIHRHCQRKVKSPRFAYLEDLR